MPDFKEVIETILDWTLTALCCWTMPYSNQNQYLKVCVCVFQYLKLLNRSGSLGDISTRGDISPV